MSASSKFQCQPGIETECGSILETKLKYNCVQVGFALYEHTC